MRKPYLHWSGIDMVFWRKGFYDPMSNILFTFLGQTWCPKWSLKDWTKKDVLKNDKKMKKNISTLAWYRYGFLMFLPFRLYQYKIFHFNRLDHVPCLLLSSLIQSYFSFQEEELKEKKSEKPYLYRPGVDMVFCKFCFKNFWTYVLRHICVNYMNFLPEVLFKTTKKAKNHIYTSSV